ncbi:hypothetical protein SBA2_800020 [Acidobacteriia bacterium SbA2]|nr:hypothetical protein SBA2_800020 [Acidobacteriia bacterium SbA2]
MRISTASASWISPMMIDPLRFVIGVKAELLHLVAKRVAGNIQEFGSVGLVSPRLLQRQADQLPLHLFERGPLSRQFQDRNHPSGGERAPGGRGGGGHNGWRVRGHAVGDHRGGKIFKTLRMARDLNRKVIGADVIGVLENHGPLHGVFQFPNVSGPVVSQQQVTSFLGDAPNALSKPEVITLDEEVNERKHVFLPVSQGRHEDWDDAETVEEVLAEAALLDGLFEIAVRSRDDPHIHADVLHSADAPDGLILQDSQQLRLEIGRHFTDFIEKQRPAVGDLKEPLLQGFGVGERPAFVAEEFGFHQGFRDGRAVDGHKRLVGAHAVVMDRLGHQVLAGAALALNQHRGGFARRYLAHEVHELEHARRFAHHLVVTGTLADLLAQAVALGAQHRAVDGVGEGNLQFVEVQRLLDEIQGAQLDRSLDIIKLGIAGDHNNRDGKVVLFDLAQDLNAAEVGQAHVKQDQVGRLGANLRQSSRAGFGLESGVAPLLELSTDGPADQFLVVDDQNLLIGHRFLWVPRLPRAWASE